MLTLKYLDTCLPDYFQGFGGEVLAVPLFDGATYQDVLDGLQSEINAWSGYMYDYQPTDKDFADLHEQAAELFNSVDMAKPWDEYAGDECYAYFGIQAEKD